MLYKEEEWATGPVWTGAGKLTPTEIINPRTVQSLGSRYTNRAISAHTIGL